VAITESKTPVQSGPRAMAGPHINVTRLSLGFSGARGRSLSRARSRHGGEWSGRPKNDVFGGSTRAPRPVNRSHRDFSN
jgi:hypothetical protein